MSKELEFLIKIVKKSEEISKEEFKVKAKDAENDLITTLDTKIEEYLIKEINKAYPDFAIVSEEFNSHHKITENCFIIDPIDGTINFANNLPLWGTQIACVKEGKTVASVICLPRIHELYYADETGAYLNGEKLQIKEVPFKNALYAVDGSNNLPALVRMRKYSSNRRNLGAVCVSMAFMAAGRIHGSVFRSDRPWDYEPGRFLCEKAGAFTKSINGFHAVAMNQEFLDILELETAVKDKKSNIFVLHSLNGDTMKTWGVDIKETFGAKDIDVFLPEFPIRAESSYERFKEILSIYLENGKLNRHSIVVAHSIANAYFIRFCKELEFVPKAYIAVAPGAVYEYPSTRNDYIVAVKKQAYVKHDAFYYVKNNLKNKYCLYSDEDDKNSEKFTRFLEDVGAEGIYLAGYNHFDGYHHIYKIPELMSLINKLL